MPPPDTAAIDHSTATSPSERPAAVRAVALKATTSPVRTVGVAGSTVSRATVLGSTCTSSVSVAEPAEAVMVARPGATARSRPSPVMAATPGLLERNVTGSERRSPCFEKGVATSVSREPATSRPGRDSSAMWAGGSGCTCTRASPNTWLPCSPRMKPTAVTRA